MKWELGLLALVLLLSMKSGKPVKIVRLIWVVALFMVKSHASVR